jgi:hypothetical protein
MFGSERWRPGDWVLLPANAFDGCTWILSRDHRHGPVKVDRTHWAVVVNVRSQTYRGRKNKRRLDPGSGPVIEVQCPATPIDKVCRFGCGNLSRRAHTHFVRASQVLEYRVGVQTPTRIERFLNPF